MEIEELLREAWNSKIVRYNVLSKDFPSPPAWYLSELATTLHIINPSNYLT